MCCYYYMKIEKINSIPAPAPIDEKLDALPKPHKVPPKKVYGHDLTKMKSFKLLRKAHKRERLNFFIIGLCNSTANCSI